MSSTQTGIEPNELAELYDSFNVIDILLDQVVKSDAFEDRAPVHPIFSWKEAIQERVKGDGWENSPCYGEQQYHRNSISINDYREEYGDGTKVTEFEAINTVRLPSDEYDRLSELIDIDEYAGIQIPVAPSSEEPIPLVVENETELEDGLDLLSEFPAFPEAVESEKERPAKDTLQRVSAIDEGQRIEELLVKVVDVEDPDRPKRDMDLWVEDMNGESFPFPIWSKHSIDADWSEGNWYWLHEARVQVWDDSAAVKRNLSSTKDLVVEPLGSSLDWDKIQTFREVYDANPEHDPSDHRVPPKKSAKLSDQTDSSESDSTISDPETGGTKNSHDSSNVNDRIQTILEDLGLE